MHKPSPNKNQTPIALVSSPVRKLDRRSPNTQNPTHSCRVDWGGWKQQLYSSHWVPPQPTIQIALDLTDLYYPRSIIDIGKSCVGEGLYNIKNINTSMHKPSPTKIQQSAGRSQRYLIHLVGQVSNLTYFLFIIPAAVAQGRHGGLPLHLWSRWYMLSPHSRCAAFDRCRGRFAEFSNLGYSRA